jgi:hypothetical protein
MLIIGCEFQMRYRWQEDRGRNITTASSEEVQENRRSRTFGSESGSCGRFLFLQKKWCARGDDFRTFLAEFVSSLPPTDLLAELTL